MADDPTLERSFRGHKDAVTSVVFNPNMKQLGPVLSVAISNTGGIIASGSKDRTVRIWAPNISKSRSSVIKAHTGGVRRVAFSEDSCSLLSASDDKTIKVWSVAGQKFRQTLSGHSNWVRAAAFNSTGDMILSGGDDKTVRLWDLSQRSCVHKFYDHTGPVHDVHFHPDGVCVAACSADTTIKIWDLRMQQLLQHYAAHEESVNSIDIHPSGDFLISASSDMATKIWDLREGHICYTLQGHDSPVNAVAFSPTGDYFATASSDENILVWKSNFDQTNSSSGFEQQSGKPSSAEFVREHVTEEIIRRPVGDGRSIAQGAQPARVGGEAPGPARAASWGARHSVSSDHLRQTQDSLLPSTQTRASSSGSHRAAPGSRDREGAAEMNMAGSLSSSNPTAGVDTSAEPLPLPSRQMTPLSIDTHALQNALENMARRMEAVQEAVQLLDRRLFLAETRLARLEAP